MSAMYLYWGALVVYSGVLLAHCSWEPIAQVQHCGEYLKYI